MHLPRSVFSDRQLNLLLFLLRVNRVENVPSVDTMKSFNAALQTTCGIDTFAYTRPLENRYHMNSLAQILAQVDVLRAIVSALLSTLLTFLSGNGESPCTPTSFVLPRGCQPTYE